MMKTETIACSHCGEALLCDERHFGIVVQCPHCANNLQVPKFAAAAEPKRAKPLAIASMILSLSSIVTGPFGFGPGIVCGHLAMRRARRAETSEGRTFARVGLAVGYLGLAV